MRADDGRLTFSPSDLTAFLACEHLTAPEMRVARGALARPERDDPQAEVIRRKGDEHEAAYLQRLFDDGRDVVEIELEEPDGSWNWERAARETEEAMRASREVVYQACFVDGGWRCRRAGSVRSAHGSACGAGACARARGRDRAQARDRRRRR